MLTCASAIRGLAFATVLGSSCAAHALTSYQYAYIYDGTTLTEDLSAAGNQLGIGDTVTLKLFATNGHWSASAGQDIWAPIGMNEPGTRTGDVVWSFLMNGTQQDSGGYTGEAHEFVHITNFTNPSVNVNFNEFDWTFTLTAYAPDPLTDDNTLGGIFFQPTGFWSDASPRFVPDNQVPEPPPLALLGFGLIGLSLRRRVFSATRFV